MVRLRPQNAVMRKKSQTLKPNLTQARSPSVTLDARTLDLRIFEKCNAWLGWASEFLVLLNITFGEVEATKHSNA